MTDYCNISKEGISLQHNCAFTIQVLGFQFTKLQQP